MGLYGLILVYQKLVIILAYENVHLGACHHRQRGFHQWTLGQSRAMMLGYLQIWVYHNAKKDRRLPRSLKGRKRLTEWRIRLCRQHSTSGRRKIWISFSSWMQASYSSWSEVLGSQSTLPLTKWRSFRPWWSGLLCGWTAVQFLSISRRSSGSLLYACAPKRHPRLTSPISRWLQRQCQVNWMTIP